MLLDPFTTNQVKALLEEGNSIRSVSILTDGVNALEEYLASLEELRATLEDADGCLALASIEFGGKDFGDPATTALAKACEALKKLWQVDWRGIHAHVPAQGPEALAGPLASPSTARRTGSASISLAGPDRQPPQRGQTFSPRPRPGGPAWKLQRFSLIGASGTREVRHTDSEVFLVLKDPQTRARPGSTRCQTRAQNRARTQTQGLAQGLAQGQVQAPVQGSAKGVRPAPMRPAQMQRQRAGRRQQGKRSAGTRPDKGWTSGDGL